MSPEAKRRRAIAKMAKGGARYADIMHRFKCNPVEISAALGGARKGPKSVPQGQARATDAITEIVALIRRHYPSAREFTVNLETRAVRITETQEYALDAASQA